MRAVALLCVAALTQTSGAVPRLNAFADRFWEWRSVTAPITSDDLPRTAVVRPHGWAPNVSAAALQAQEARYEALAAELSALRGGDAGFAAWGAADQADYWAMTAALNRVYWELYVFVPAWRDPGHYLQQSYGAVWDLLVSVRDAGGWDAATVHNLRSRLGAIPAILRDGAANLAQGTPRAPLARLYLNAVGYDPAHPTAPLTVAAALVKATDAVLAEAAPPPTPASRRELRAAAAAAGAALADFTAYVAEASPRWDTNASVGEGGFQWFLRHVAFVNYTTAELVGIGRQQLARADAMLAAEKAKNDAADPRPVEPPVQPSLPAQVDATAAASDAVRQFLEERRLLAFPEWFGDAEYTVSGIPPWLAPFGYGALGEEDTFTSPAESRRGVSFRRYVPPPAAGLGFFMDVLARDPRPVIVHEGIPGHWTQFRFSWRHPRHARRRWLDSTANEGLAYYFEEALMQAGLFDNAPRLRETMFRFMRLRAVRVEADVALATGEMSVEEAAAYFEHEVPMAHDEAVGEVLARLAAPGQGLSYVVGKVQAFEYQRAVGDRFRTLGAFHTSLEENGNLPFALQMHSAGVPGKALDKSFLNLHTRYEGGGAPDAAAHPALVRRLPGAPPGSAPAMFSGYASVGGGARRLFYYAVRSEKAGADVPVVVWLQGGNGCSSLLGAFSEHGPFSAGADGLKRNAGSLHRLAHVVYLDRPAGAGYSYSTEPFSAAWANDAQTAQDGYDALRSIFAQLPWLCRRTVWIAGESYAGHFTIQLASVFANASRTDGTCATLGGVLAGNAVVDINQTNYAWFEAGATHALVEEEVWGAMKRACDFTKDLGVDGNGCPRGVSAECGRLVDVWMNQSAAGAGGISLYDFYSDVCVEGGGRAGHGRGRFAAAPDPCAERHTTEYLNRADVRRSLHADAAAGPWAPCSQALNDAYSCPDTLVSVAPLYEALLNNPDVPYRVLVYSGDVDGVVPTLASKRWVEGVGHKTIIAPWQAWADARGQTGGYRKAWAVGPRGNQLVFATVRGAGHQVPTFQPQRAHDLFAWFLGGGG